MAGNLLSGKFWNQVADTIYERYNERVDALAKMMLADGYPPFHQPTTPYEQYQALSALKNSQSSYYWDNPQAQLRLQQLEQRFGPSWGMTNG